MEIEEEAEEEGEELTRRIKDRKQLVEEEDKLLRLKPAHNSRTSSRISTMTIMAKMLTITTTMAKLTVKNKLIINLTNSSNPSIKRNKNSPKKSLDCTKIRKEK